MRTFLALLVAALPACFAQTAAAQETDLGKYSDFTPFQERWLTSEPRDPSPEWLLAYGGRLYDNWMKLVDRGDPPATRHPAYPAEGKQKGSGTWRCKECHGWDYAGVHGAYGNKQNSHYTGIGGIRSFAGGDPAEVIKILRDETHQMDSRMLPKWAAERLALFVTQGQIFIEDYMDDAGALKGDADKGRATFQNLCAVCHGYDGRSINFGSDTEPKYVGHYASGNPQEVLHKARNGHPGGIMLPNIWMDPQILIDTIVYAQTLEEK